MVGNEIVVPMDDKAKRMRDLLSSFYSLDPSISNTTSKHASLDDINSTSFDPDQYMNILAHKSNLEGLLQRHVAMAAEIKNLDTDLQMLVYENYNKFISATDTIKRMKSNISGMETNMEQLLEKIMSVQSRSDSVNTSLFDKREHIEKLHRTCNLLRKVQFIYDLPDRLGKCIKSEAYADAVRFYIGAMPIFKAYGDSSFRECKQASEEAIAIVVKNLQGKLFSDSESIQVRADAAVLLKQLDFPVNNLKAKLFEKLEQSISDIQLNPEEINKASGEHSAHEAAIHEFVEAVRAFRVIFPDSEEQLVKLAQDLVTKNFVITEEYVKTRISPEELLGVLRAIWNDVLLIDEVLQEAALSNHSLEAAKVAVTSFVRSTFSHLLQDISDSLLQILKKDGAEQCTLDVVLDASTKAVLQGGLNVLLYVNMRTQRVSLLLKKRFTTPNWVKHKEPRDVHMFVDLFLQELEVIVNEVKQTLPQGRRKHHRTDSNGSSVSSRSNPLREEKLGRSNTQRARSQLFETHLAKLFKQKVEIFTKVEYTQESVVTTIVKLGLKSLQEFVRLQTFNRSGFQQIQLDIQFLRIPLREIVEDEAAIDFLLDEVIVATAERCLDPIPLEPPILDKLIRAKLAKTEELNTISS
ncbi:Vacuolar protein sorting-associated protein 51-like isoform C [Glycine soja]|uniref:Vacuolar protein sorting-associated protein 51 homolog n=1 Tax=Glycine soja TaxID=3848 RepID=A0A445LI43_GLYSO|nr:Vacuolar protein sorting-associated protein 51-like isoform C [Glycine soja]